MTASTCLEPPSEHAQITAPPEVSHAAAGRGKQPKRGEIDFDVSRALCIQVEGGDKALGGRALGVHDRPHASGVVGVHLSAVPGVRTRCTARVSLLVISARVAGCRADGTDRSPPKKSGALKITQRLINDCCSHELSLDCLPQAFPNINVRAPLPVRCVIY